ncbi:MAG TPA: transglycosylase domain-containing protein [Aggregatilineaceae bacterium]|nr:transglycosylase domain-containing protein [Aggregatilineaceae bacterium]
MAEGPDPKTTRPDDAANPPQGGWHEPPVDAEASRPVTPGGWYTPENAPSPEPAASAPPSGPAAGSQPPSPEPTAPGAAPAQTGGWYRPLDSRIDDLLGGAADTIVEGTGASQGGKPPDATQAQAAHDTQSQPPPDDESGTPILDARTAQPVSRATGPVIEEPPRSTESTPVPADTPPEPAAAVTPEAATEPEPSPFEQAERKIAVLRQRYQAGQLTREELQKELRNLMILDDEGHWWMLGLESNRWYYYDGRDWVPGTPPGHEKLVRGSSVRTETGLQEVIDAEGTVGRQAPAIELDEDNMPLPQHVPQEDMGATLVSPASPLLEPVRRSDAPTRPKGQQVEIDRGGFVASPLSPQVTQPARPIQAGSEDLTIQTVPVPGEQTMPSAAQAGGVTVPHVIGGAAAEAISKPKPRLGEFPQPDYSAALNIEHNRAWYTKWGIRLAVIGVIGGMALTLIVLLGMVAYYFYIIGAYDERVAQLGDLVADFETTRIFDANGTQLAEFNSPETGARTEVPLAQISPWLIHATIATENETFYTDPGFSVLAIVRAAIQNIQAGQTVSGASTITQQLARALVLDTEFARQISNERKLTEVIVASEIVRQYDKNQILEIYLNEFFYGNLAYGVEAASQTYFGKPARDLNPAEAAFIAGLPQSPATYDPVINREAAMGRMEQVLRLMSEANGTGCITIQHQDESEWQVPSGGTLCVTAVKQPAGDVVYYYQAPGMAEPQEMTLDITRVKIAEFKRPEFRATHPHFVNYVWQQLEESYGTQAIYSAGFRVYTTLNEPIQSAAEQAVTEHLAYVNQVYGARVNNASVVVIRPADGAVMAMVGSADYYNDEIDGQVNVAFTAQQAGSAIKPLVYLSAFEPDDAGRYLTPASVIWDVPTNFNGYIPRNFDGTFNGPVSVRYALGNSLNIPAVKTLERTGIERFTALAKRVGIVFPLGDPVERQAGLPTALGAVEVRLFDMVSAFAMLANNGRRIEPYSIVYIEDSQGNEVYRANTSPQGLQVVNPEYAYLITNILSDNDARAAEFGRGQPMELSGGRPAAIKTGTSGSQNIYDVWALGYTPQFVTGVWVGNTDDSPIYNVTGYYAAAPIWNRVMEVAHQGQPIQQFVEPPGIVRAEICADSGTLPSQFCAGRTRTEIFAQGAPPPGADRDIFRQLQVDGYTGKLANQYCQDDVEQRTFVAISDPAAYDWINNGGGASWATSRGLELPVMPPPSEECAPNEPRPFVVVSSPAENQTVQGVIQLRGAVTMPDFNRYEVRYGVSHAPEAFSQPILVETVQRPEGESVLGEIDTRQLQNGPYTLRLVAIDAFGRDVRRDIHINIDNPQPTATPAPTLAPTPTLGPDVFATPLPEGVLPPGVLPSPTLAPTLTPTWTLTPTP